MKTSQATALDFRRISGFSLVELIVVITLISILTVIGVTYGNNYKLTQYNVRRMDDIKTLTNAMESYIQAKKSLPEVVANAQFYDIK
jgi:prepilin-type N-terminal cleavage/methylation domain-containing protein